MRLPRGKFKTRPTANKFQYETLEHRQLLATLVSFNVGTGDLNIELTSDNDTAVVDIASGNVTVNGSDDMDTAASGVQTVAVADLRIITIDGDNTKTNQQVTFNGDYSNANGALLQSMSIQDVKVASFNGTYQLAGNLNATLINDDGQIDDGLTGQLIVGGTTTITANNNEIILDNVTNDFVGDFSASNTGTGRDIVVNDANDLQFGSIVSSGDLRSVVVGNLTDTTGAPIAVAGDGRFTATSVVFGDNAGDVTNFNRFQSITSGLTELNEDSTVILLDITSDNLIVRSSIGIFDGRSTSINVTNKATFEAGSRIRIGENGTDTFNAGTVNFTAGGHVHIWEDSATVLTGVNTASSLNLFSAGSITDDATSFLNVTNVTGFEALSVVLGDTATDQFNTGSMYFSTPGDFFVTEDSGIHLIETKNTADRMILTSPGSITDANDAVINVTRLSIFNANGVNIGDSVDDVFNSGSILFNTAVQFKLTENSNTNLVGNNVANNAIIESTGGITNSTNTSVAVATVAEFTGTSINLGGQTGDTMNFGGLRVNSAGVVTVAEDSSTNLTFSSTAGQLSLTSTAGVTDALTATVNVGGIVSVQGTSINLGDAATDEFNAGELTLNSSGAVFITEDSSLSLVLINTADSMSLAAAGVIADATNADTRVTNRLTVVGTAITLGSTAATDHLEFGSLTFTSTLNTNISADSNITLAGISSGGDQLFLNSTGNITDNADAETRIQNKVFLTGVDVIIGELADDCFDILNGDASDLFVTASGTNSVTLGCP